jgi:hypothetical protein
MNQIPVTQQRELKWKLKDGTLVPIKDLNDQQLQNFRKIAAKKVDDFYRNYEFFSEILECMDDELQNRIFKIKYQLELLEKVQAEI